MRDKAMAKESTKSIEILCKMHRTTRYFDDGEGLIGVYNHRNVVLWYRFIPLVGCSLVGETKTPGGVQLRRLKAF